MTDNKHYQSYEGDTCEWKHKRQSPDYRTSCGDVYDNDLSMQACDFSFCPYCGKEIKVKKERAANKKKKEEGE